MQQPLPFGPMSADPDKVEITVNAMVARQPIGDVILATFPYKDIIRIAHFDVRRLVSDERDVERYLGIQRPLIPQRVHDLEKYVGFADATFPTAIIVAIEEDYADFDPEKLKLTIRNYRLGEDAPSINIRHVARVIDGQHRIAGLMKYQPEAPDAPFDVPVTVFVGADIADQAYVFSTVNLEQTKVSKSLALDLYELARTRSPFKTCHNIAVALDRDQGGPLHERIKRLGFATEGRVFEPITQATFVDVLLPYISSDPKVDRDLLLKGKRLMPAQGRDAHRTLFRQLFIEEQDVAIGRIVSEYFYAVRDRWPQSWDYQGPGQMLNRTNGVRALVRALGHFYVRAAKSANEIPTRQQFLALLRDVPLADGHFSVEGFPPGTSGESKLRRVLVGEEAPPPNA
jgi:DGQHR domain-containing protein